MTAKTRTPPKPATKPVCQPVLIATFRDTTLAAVERSHRWCYGLPCWGRIDPINLEDWQQ